MRRARNVLFVVLASLASLASSSLTAQSTKSDKTKSVIAEFCRRAATVSPLDAKANYDLAYWCSQSGLSKHARAYLTRTISIDSDHPAARKALGYERHGSGWILSASKKKPSGGESGGDNDDGTEGTEVVVIEPEDGSEDGSGEPVVDAAEVPSPDEDGAPSTEIDAGVYAEELLAKKEWAQLVSERMQHELQTYEDDDLLVHTTLPSIRHPKVLQLLLHLKTAKKLVEQSVGVKSSKTPLWPAKVQFLVLRSETQYEQFAELIDDEEYANKKTGAYTKEGHTVLHNPAAFLVVRRLALDALETLHSVDKQYSWWLIEGVAERIVCVAKMSRGTTDKEKQTFYRNYNDVADILKSGKDELSIYDLLESRELKRRDTDRGRSRAMTLVDFLSRSRRKGFSTLLTNLKGTDAPLVPDEEDDDAWKTYWLNYFAFQEKTLEVAFKKNTDELDLLWKRHVLEVASKHSGSAGGRDGSTRRTRGRNR